MCFLLSDSQTSYTETNFCTPEPVLGVLPSKLCYSSPHNLLTTLHPQKIVRSKFSPSQTVQPLHTTHFQTLKKQQKKKISLPNHCDFSKKNFMFLDSLFGTSTQNSILCTYIKILCAYMVWCMYIIGLSAYLGPIKIIKVFLWNCFESFWVLGS